MLSWFLISPRLSYLDALVLIALAHAVSEYDLLWIGIWFLAYTFINPALTAWGESKRKDQ